MIIAEEEKPLDLESDEDTSPDQTLNLALLAENITTLFTNATQFVERMSYPQHPFRFKFQEKIEPTKIEVGTISFTKANSG